MGRAADRSVSGMETKEKGLSRAGRQVLLSTWEEILGSNIKTRKLSSISGEREPL